MEREFLAGVAFLFCGCETVEAILHGEAFALDGAEAADDGGEAVVEARHSRAEAEITTTGETEAETTWDHCSGSMVHSVTDCRLAISLQAADEQLALEDHFLGQVAGELQEELFLAEDFALELVVGDGLEGGVIFRGELQAFEVDVLPRGIQPRRVSTA